MPRRPPPPPEAKPLGRRIRARRKDLGLTIEQFSERADQTHVTYLAAIERGERNPTLRVLVRLARALDTDLGELTKGLAITDG